MERAYSATGNSRVHYLKSGYVIQLIAFGGTRLVYALHQTLPSLGEVGVACKTILQVIHAPDEVWGRD